MPRFYFSFLSILISVVSLHASESKTDIITNCVTSIKEASTVYYRGTVTTPNGNVKQTYYLLKKDGVLNIRVENVGNAFGVEISTTIIKNKNGTFYVGAKKAIRVPDNFTDDQLRWINPFANFIKLPQYRKSSVYTNETIIEGEFIVVCGSRTDAEEKDRSTQNGPKKYIYKISRDDKKLTSLHEESQKGHVYDVTFENMVLNKPIDAAQFILPSHLSEQSVASFQDFGKALGADYRSSSNFREENEASRRRVWITRSLVLIFALFTSFFIYRLLRRVKM